MRYSNAADAVASVVNDVGDRLAVWDDELYLEYHRGVQTTWADMKRWNRRSEGMLQTAEAIAVAAGGDYPRRELESAWRQVLFNQFHDILPGSGIREIYYDAHAFYDSAWVTLDSITAAAFAGLRSRMDTRGQRSVVVFNPLGWERSGYVTSDTPEGPTRFFVEDVPAFGARAVHLPDADERWSDGDAEAGPDWISNQYLRVEFDTATGDIVSIRDREEDREVLAAGGRANVLRVFDDLPTQWDAWNIDITGDNWDVQHVSNIQFGVDGQGAFVELVRTWGDSFFRQRLRLDRGSRMIDVDNDFEWHERRKMLKAVFELGVTADSATYEIPYGTIGRSGVPRTQQERAKHEVPGQRWADVSQDDYGVSILNDSKYGWDYHGNVLRLSLLRSPIWPDSLADRGRQVSHYAIYPHRYGWEEAGTLDRATEYNVPMLAAWEPEHRGELGRDMSLARSNRANVRVEWLKRAEDSDRLVIRLVEWHGEQTEAEIDVGCRIRTAHTANLLEDESEELDHGRNSVRVAMRPYQIQTLLIGCDQ
jgi:alpha-mannosidase